MRFKVSGIVLALVVSVVSLVAVSFQPASAANPDCSDFPATNQVYFNDPDVTESSDGESGNHIRHLVWCRITGTDSGVIRVVMFNISDTWLAQALADAKQDRGVDVRVIVDNQNCSQTAVELLKDELGQNGSANSFVLCRNSRRSPTGGNIHQKSMTFSEGDITLVGSANLTTEAYADQWNDMFQYVDRNDIFNAYNHVFTMQKDGSIDQPYYEWVDADGAARANFTPVNDATPDAGDDPILTRLKNIPHNSNTTVWVAAYGFRQDRGVWLAQELARLKNSGATVKVIVGPGGRDNVLSTLQGAGIPVTRGHQGSCPATDWPDTSSCNYIHHKFMAARYMESGAWVHRSYTGSDNWADDGLINDDVTHRIGGERTYDDYVAWFQNIAARYPLI